MPKPAGTEFHRTRQAPCGLLWIIAGLVLVGSRVATADSVQFERDLAPVLERHCLRCHNGQERRGGLSLESAAALAQGGDSGEVVVAGEPDASYLLELVSPVDGFAAMPKGEAPLGQEQRDLIRRWIAAGADWPADLRLEAPQLWSLQPLERPAVPRDTATDGPFSKGNPIDAFVAAARRDAGITPLPPADRRTLIRRLSLDLVGLPPDPADVEAFVADSDPLAYERLVDQLLASPHFGERWGRYWLDLARYADSDGYLGDGLRPHAWVYREWVINAINRDLPFDEFTIQQLAGDLLENATREENVATGFHRNTLRNTEAGVDLELYRTKEIVDRVNTTGTVWLGLTLGCAECHDHKHDPVTQEEFYRLYAFFNNANEVEVPAPRSWEMARHELAQQRWQASYDRLEQQLERYQQQELAARQEECEAAIEVPDVRWSVLVPESAESGGGNTMEIQEDGSIVAGGKNPPTATYTIETSSPLETITALRLEVIGHFGNGTKRGEPVGRHESGQFVLSSVAVSLRDGEDTEPVGLKNAVADFAEPDQPLAQVLDTSTTQGWTVASRPYQRHAMVVQLEAPLTLPEGSQLVFSLRQKHGKLNTLRHFRLLATDQNGPLRATPVSQELAAVLRKPPEARSDCERETVAAYRRSTDATWSDLRRKIEQHLKERPAPPTTKAPVFVERTKDRRESFVHVRGVYTQRGPTVTPGTPEILPNLPTRGSRADRLDLARWLMREENPLTARVTVNRIWQRLFGVGLVATSDDFGTKGARPTHPLLLDWLATELRQVGWSRKAMIRRIVTSSTYQLASSPFAAHPQDPGNKLLWRQNSYRVPAETVRDLHLAASGLLDRSIGGRGIRPPLPGFVTEVGRSVKWPLSEGGDRYRRGMYIFLKRTVPYPMLMTFDAPDTTASCSRRERSNSPLQALTLLNDPAFLECAEALGRDISERYGGGGSPHEVEAAIGALFLRCLARPPSPRELEHLRSAHDDLLQFAKQGRLRENSAEHPELAALTAVARIIMNLDEFITRD